MARREEAVEDLSDSGSEWSKVYKEVGHRITDRGGAEGNVSAET